MNDPGQRGLWSIPGDGVLARQGNLVLLVSIDDPGFVESLVDLLARTSAAGGDGHALTDAIGAQVEHHRSWGELRDGPAVVAFGPAGDGLAFAVSGTAFVDISTSHGSARLAAGHPSMLLRSVLGIPVQSVRAGLGGDGPSDRTDRFTRLDSGTVRASGLSYLAPSAPPAPSVPVAPVAAPAAPSAPAAPAAPAEPATSPAHAGPVPGPGPAPRIGPREPALTEPTFHPSAQPLVQPSFQPRPPVPADPPSQAGIPAASAPPEPAPAQAEPTPPPSQYTPPGQYTPPREFTPPGQFTPPPVEPPPVEPAPGDWASREEPGTGPAVLYELGLEEPGVTGPGPAPATSLASPAIQPAVGPAPDLGYDAAQAGEDVVLGVHCKNGHFTDPSARSCVVCGTGTKRRSTAPQRGARPPLGVLILDDGATLSVDGDYVIGRDPSLDQWVSEGRARQLRVVDADQTVSRIHARIQVIGWQVLLMDLGSANGTHLQQGGTKTEPVKLQPRVPVVLHHGARLYVGTPCIRYERSGGS